MKRLRHLLAGVAALALLPGLAWAQTNDGLKQQTVRAATGTARDYNGDWSALFDQAGIAPGPFNQRMLAWINGQLSSSYTDLNDALNAFAVSQGAPNWSSLGTFTIGGTTYVAHAFRNDPNTTFGTSSALTSAGTTVSGGDTGPTADTSVFTMAFAVRAHATNGDASSSYTALNGDFITAAGGAGYSSEGIPGINLSFDNSNNANGNLRVNIGDASATNATINQNNCNAMLVVGSGGLIQDQWTVYVISFDGRSTTSATKALAVYQNGTSYGTGCDYRHGNVLTSTAMTVPFASSPTPGWYLTKPVSADPKNTYDFDYVMEDFSTSIVCVDTNSITVNGVSYACPGGANTIPAALLAKFWNGGFVDPGANCAALGRTPQICLKGGASSFTTNQGTLTGLTLTGPAYSAPYDIAGIPAHHAVNVWAYNAVGLGSVTTVTTSMGAHTITQGNLLVLALAGADGSVSTGNHNLTCPSGWTLQYVGYDNNAGENDPTDLLICTKVAGAAETGAYTLSWTNAFTHGSMWALLEYAGVNSVEAAAGTVSGGAGISSCTPASSNATSCSAPSVTASVSNDTLVSLLFWYNTGAATVPAGQDGVDLGPGSSTSQPELVASDMYLTASGATGAQQFTTLPAAAGQAVNILLKPN